MDTDIREALARSMPDLALIVRRDGVILSCVGGHAVRGLDPEEQGLPGRTLDAVWPEGIATHALQTVRRILKTRKAAQQRYQEGDVTMVFSAREKRRPRLETFVLAPLRAQGLSARDRNCVISSFIAVQARSAGSLRIERHSIRGRQ